MLAKNRRSLAVLAALAASATWCGSAVAQNISAVPVTPVPVGTGQPVSVNIVNSLERDDIIGYHFKVSYNASEVSFVDVTDPAGAEAFDGQSGAGQAGDAPAAGFSDFVVVEGDSLSAVADRGALVTLNFNTAATYTGSLDLHIDSYPDANSGLTIDNAGNVEHITPVIDNDGTVYTIPTLTSISQHYNVIDEATADYTLTVTGTNFEADTVFEFDGAPLATTVDSSTQLTVTLPNELVDEVGEWLVNVDNGDNVESNETVYYTAVSQATVNVDDLWEGESHEERVAAGMIFGVNAFSDINPAAVAVDANGVVSVEAGTYDDEAVVLGKPLTLAAATATKPVVSVPTSASNAAVISVQANDVSIAGLKVLVNQPYAAAGIAAKGSALNRNNLVITDNEISTSGSGGSASAGGHTPFGLAAGIAIYGQDQFNCILTTIQGNVIGSDTNPFQGFAMQLEKTGGLIGGPAAGDGNVTFGLDFDINARFQDNGVALTIEGNEFRGWGDERNRGAQVEIGDQQNATVIVRNNLFAPQVDNHGKVHRRSLQVKNFYNTNVASTVDITGNTFQVRNTGVAITNAIRANVTGNFFDAVEDGVYLLEVNNKIYSSGDSHQNSATNSVVIKGNEFSAEGHANVTAVEFRDHTQTNAAKTGNPPVSVGPIVWDSIVLGGAAAGETNKFAADLATFISLDNHTGLTSTYPEVYGVQVGEAVLFDTTMAPFSQDIVAKDNQFDLGNGLKTPATLGADEMLLLESKVQHKRDFAALGSVLFYQRVENLNTNELFDFVQDAINDPQTLDGHEIAVSAGLYAESSAADEGLLINKAVTITGPNAGIAGNAVRNPEAVFVPAEKLNNGGNTANLDTDSVVEIAAAGVVLNGVKISGDNPGIDSPLYAGLNHEANNGIYTHANNVQIINNVLENFTYTAIEGNISLNSTPVSGFLAQNNYIQNVHDLQANGWGYGIIIANHAGTVSQNWIENTRKGIQVQAYKDPIGGLVENNDIYCWERGLYMNYNQTGAKWTMNNNRVNGIAANSAMTFKTPFDGIRVETMFSTSAGADITNNVVNGALAQADATHDAWGEFGDDAVFGIRFVNSNSTSNLVTFSGNQISNVQHGLALESPVEVAFSGNTVNAVGDYIRLQTAYDANGNTNDIGGTGLVDATGGNVLGGAATGSATLAQLFAIEDKITHAMDNEALGLARVVADTLYVTPNTDSIQRGVDLSEENDTVHVQAGDYFEATKAVAGDNTALSINKTGLKVYGPNTGIAGNGARNPEANVYAASLLATNTVDDDEPVVYISSPNVEFAGFHVSGDTPNAVGHSIAGLDVHACTGIYSQADGVKVVNNLVTNAVFIGIRSGAFNTTDPAWIHQDVEFTGNKVTAIYDLSGTPTDVDDWRFYMNGIYFQGSTGKVNNNVVENLPYGMQIQPYHASGVVAEVKNNQISAWRRAFWYNYTNASANRWTIEGNTIVSVARPAIITGGSTSWEGIRLENINNGVNGGLFNLNTVDGTVAMADTTHDNWGSFANAVWGIHVTASSSTNIDFENTTVNNVEHALVYAANSDQTLTTNNFTAAGDVVRIQRTVNGSGVVSTTGGQGELDATAGNTFNGVASASATLPQLFDIEDVITHKVDNVDLGLVRVVTDNIYVTGNGNTINNGVAAAETDDIVNLKNGTYGEDVAIAKYVTLLAQTAGNVVINTGTSGVVVDMPAEAGTFNLNGINFTGTAAQALVIDAAGSAGTFALQDLVFTGLSDSSVAAAVSGSANGGTFSNVDVNNSGTGIVLANSSAVTISGSDITDNFGSGILVWKWDVNNTTPATANNITIQNNIITDNGVSFDTVNNVQVVDNVEAYGILVARRDDTAVTTAVTGPSATNLVISGNTVTNNAATGIFLSQVSNDGNGLNSVTGNTIEQNGQSGTIVANPTNMKNTDGIKVNSSRNVAVTNNFINENQRFGVLVRSVSGEVDAGEGVVVTSNHIEANEPIDYAKNGQFIGGGLLIQLNGDPSKEIAATNNWWGHAYGPFNPTLYPTGRGDAYEPQSGSADVSPWYGFRPAAEIWYTLNDRDGDGILDAYEDLNLDAVKQSVESDRAAKDSDGDLFEDGVEVALGSDPWDATSKPDPGHALISFSQSTADADADGYKDFYEVAFGTNPNDVNDHPELGNVVPGDEIKQATDLSSLRQVLVGTKAMTLSTIEQQNMDMNRDGYVSNIDAIALRRFHGGTQTLPIK